jgi:hypothetical protein
VRDVIDKKEDVKEIYLSFISMEVFRYLPHEHSGAGAILPAMT